MYEVHFYQDADGNQPLREYLDKLEAKQRIQEKTGQG